MKNRLRYAILAADLIWIMTACLFAHLLRFRLITPDASRPTSTSFYIFSVCAALIVWTILYSNKDLDGFSRGWYFPRVFAQVFAGAFVLMGSLLALGFLTKINYSRLALLFLGGLLPIGFLVIRCAAWWLVKSWSRLGLGAKRRVVIVGSGRIAQELANRIANHPEMMIELVGRLYPSDVTMTPRPIKSKAGIIGVRTLNVLDLLKQKKVQELILTEHLPLGTEMEKLITNCHRAGMQVHLVPQWYELYSSRAQLSEIDEVPLISVESRSVPFGSLELKWLMDLVGGVVMLILASPAIAVIALALHRKKGGAFKRETRCGENGKLFPMFRFNIDRWASNLVGFDKFLASMSLTELPQLWNVIRGEMSLVGPRPESPERVKHYSAWQRQRLQVKPGLTGLAQVHGLREQHSSEDKAQFDVQYIYRWSLFLDLSIFLQTIWTLAFRPFVTARPTPSVAGPSDKQRWAIREGMHVNRTQPSSD